MITLVGYLQGSRVLKTGLSQIQKVISLNHFQKLNVSKRNFSTEIDRILASLSDETSENKNKQSSEKDVSQMFESSALKLKNLLNKVENLEDKGNAQAESAKQNINQESEWLTVFKSEPGQKQQQHREAINNLAEEADEKRLDEDLDDKYGDDYAIFIDYASQKGKPIYWWADMVVAEGAEKSFQNDEYPRKIPYTKLKYTQHYPLKVRNWVRDMRTPKGFYDEFGFWRDTGVPIAPHDPVTLLKELRHNPDQSDLPADLRGAYRFGIKPEEIQNYPPKLKEIMSFRYATHHEKLQFRLRRLTEHYRIHWRDTGSADVQIARMTERIKNLIEHTKKHPKDKQTQYQLNLLVWQRVRMMKYLRRKNVARYFRVLKGVGLRDFPFKPARWPNRK